MSNRETCVFYASWLEAIETMPEAAQSEAYRAVLTYALRGVETAKQGAMTKLVMAMVRPVIDANNKRYENGCKGGRPKVEEPNQNQNETKPKPKRNQTKTKTKPNQNQNETTSQVRFGDNVNDNDNDNDNVNVNVNESVCDKSHDAHTRTRAVGFDDFIKWCYAYGLHLAVDFKEPLTESDFQWLLTKYGVAKMKECASELHNKEAASQNRRAITTWKAFIKNI